MRGVDSTGNLKPKHFFAFLLQSFSRHPLPLFDRSAVDGCLTLSFHLNYVNVVHTVRHCLKKLSNKP